MRESLYGPGGFFVTDAPAAHFRTSVHASPLFAGALLRLLTLVDEQLGSPYPFDVVDVGAGRGELLRSLAAAAPPDLAARLRLTAVELAPAPVPVPPGITWRAEPPEHITGLLLATEWLDNVPLDLAQLDGAGTARYVLTDDSLGEPVGPADREWLDRWWPLSPGGRAEIGVPRDEAWAAAVSTVDRGLAVAVDYGHVYGQRPILGTLTGYRLGRAVPPVPDKSCDLTAHVAFDALATPTSTLLRQREALHGLGVDGARPPLALASTAPADYLRALSRAGAAAELTDPAGLGGHFWLLQPVDIGPAGLGFGA
jgi:SAM-dependent MidA family methyltransferase